MNPDFVPKRSIITNISNSSQAVITTISNHDYTVGQEVRIVVPLQFGMTQINGLSAQVLSVPGLNSIIVNIDSSDFDTFLYPVSPNITLPQVIPMGEVAKTPFESSLDGSTRNIATQF